MCTCMQKHVEHVFPCPIFWIMRLVSSCPACLSHFLTPSSRFCCVFCIRKAFPETFQQEGVLHGVSSNLVILDDGTSNPVNTPEKRLLDRRWSPMLSGLDKWVIYHFSIECWLGNAFIGITGGQEVVCGIRRRRMMIMMMVFSQM